MTGVLALDLDSAWCLARSARRAWGDEARALFVCEEASGLAKVSAQWARGQASKQDVAGAAWDAIQVALQACELVGVSKQELMDMADAKSERLAGHLRAAGMDPYESTPLVEG